MLSIAGKRRICLPLLACFLLIAGVAGAEEALHHGEKFELRRDGSLIINFLILASGLFWVTFRFGIPALKNRSKGLAESMEKAEAARKMAMERLAELEKKIKEFEAQSAKIRQDAVEQGEQTKAKIIEEARAMALRIIEKAREDIESEAGKAQERLRRDAARLAAELAGDILRKNYGEADHRNSVRDFIKYINAKGHAK